MNGQQEQQTSNLRSEVWSALWTEALLADGRSDAFAFALKCDGDLAQLRKQIQEIEEMMSDLRMLRGPMAPDSGPRIYREGYLSGLKDALAIASQATVEREKQTVNTEAKC